MQYYWELITRDGTKYDIPPDKVAIINRRMAAHDPINLSTATVPFAQIDTFRVTERPYNQQPLLDTASQVFNTEQINPDGSVVSAWVKKSVTNDKWNRYYGANPSYKKLGDSGGMVEIAFRLPIHSIDVNVVSYLTAEEELRITR